MTTEVPVRKVSIQPIELLKSSYAMLGDQYWTFAGIVFVGILIGSAVPMGIIMGPMMCGIYLCYMHRYRNKPVDFNVLFKGFDYFMESLVAMLVMVGIMMVVILPMYLVFFVFFAVMMAASDGEPEPEMAIAMMTGMGVFYLIFFLVILLISLPFIFVFPLIVDRQMKAIPALKASARGAWANLGGLMVMTLVFSFISILASCACYFPVFLFAPISFGAIYLVYEKIFGDVPAGKMV